MTRRRFLPPARPMLMAAWLCASVTAGCDDPSAQPPAPGPVTQAAAAPASPVNFDGVYEGTRTPQTGGPECGFESAVGYEISQNHIWLRTHKQRRALDGTVDGDGRFLMSNATGDHQITGTIVGDHLTGTETASPRHHKGFPTEPGAEAACLAQIDARRGAPGAADAPD